MSSYSTVLICVLYPMVLSTAIKKTFDTSSVLGLQYNLAIDRQTYINRERGVGVRACAHMR